MEGKVKFFNEVKGFGFITTDEGDHFVHKSGISESVTLKQGDSVVFDIVELEGKKKAHNVVLKKK